MTQIYEIRKRMLFRTIFSGIYEIVIDGDVRGQIEPVFGVGGGGKAHGYYTHLMLENNALSDDSGFPNQYRYLKEAKAAVADIMTRNGIEGTATPRVKGVKAEGEARLESRGFSFSPTKEHDNETHYQRHQGPVAGQWPQAGPGPSPCG